MEGARRQTRGIRRQEGGKQEGASEGEKMKGSRNEERKDRETREERKRPKGRDRHGEEDLFSK